MRFSPLLAREKWLLTVLGVAAFYYVAARLGLLLAFEATNASPVWPPSGIALAAVLLLGYRVWPGIFLGAFAANLVVFAANKAADGVTIGIVSSSIAAGNTLEGLAGAFLIHRLIGSASPFAQPQQVFKFGVIAPAVCLVGAVVGTVSLVLSGIAPASLRWAIGLTWWLGDAAGLLIVAPVIISWFDRPPLRWHWRTAVEILGLSGLLILIGVVVFGGRSPPGGADRLLTYLFIPCLAWAAFRFGVRGVTAASVLVTGMAVWGTTRGLGPFARGNLNDSLILLEVFVALCCVTGLVLAADLKERRRLTGAVSGRDIAVPWVALLACLWVTVLAWHFIASGTEQGARERFNFLADGIKSRITERMQGYEQVLRGGAGLFAASQSVDRDGWHEYVQQLRIDENFPGIQGIGHVRRVTAADKDAHVRQVRAEGFPDYVIKPEGEREEYYPIVYLEPFDERNRRAFGLDLSSEPVRRAGLIYAGDTDDTAVTGKITLVQEIGKNIQSGFLMYVPVYRNGAPKATVEQRRAALLGFVYSPFRVNDLMRGILGAASTGVALEIFDGRKTDAGALMYDSEAGRPNGNGLPSIFTSQAALNIKNQPWTLRFTALPVFEATIDRQKAQTVLIAGIVISLLFFIVVRFLAVTRETALALANDMTAALRESETKFRSLAESAKEAIIITDAQGRVVSWNRGAEAIFGYAEQEITGRELTRMMPEPYRDRHTKGMAGLRSGGEARLIGKTIELEGLRKDDRKFPLELSLSTWEAGGERFYSGIIRDISERNLAAETLRKSEERFRLMVDGVTDYAMITLDLDGRVASWNAGAERITGYHVDEIIGQHVSCFYLPEVAARGHPRYELQVVATEGRFEEENWRIRKDGSRFWAGVVITALRDDTGALRGFCKVTRDLTERKQTEDVLMASERRFRSVMAHAPIGMAIVGLDGRWLEVNGALSDIVGYSKVELEKMAFHDITYPEDVETDLNHVQALLDGRVRSYQMEKRYFRKHDGHVWVLQTASLVWDDNRRPLYFIWQIEDITERKEKERVINDAFREKETLLKEVYHRVKNNLQVVTSLLNLQQRTLPEGQARVALTESANRIRAMALVHEQLYQSGNLSSIALDDYIRNLCQRLGAAVGVDQQGVVIICDAESIDIGLDTAVPLGLLLNELIANSLKHAFPEGRTGEVRVELRRKSADLGCLAVSDNGVGFPQEMNPAPSLSLGLKLVETLSRQLDGRLSFESVGGTRIIFEFPIRYIAPQDDRSDASAFER